MYWDRLPVTNRQELTQADLSENHHYRSLSAILFSRQPFFDLPIVDTPQQELALVAVAGLYSY